VQRQQATYPARVAVTGYMHEVNAFADPITLAHGIDAAQGPGGLAGSWEARPLIDRLHAGTRPVEVVEAPVWEFGASGPLDDVGFAQVVAQVRSCLGAAGALDAVVVLGHGAGRTIGDLDSDATFLEMVRDVVGPDVPVVVVLDFHANLSGRMCAAVDAVVGYRTNPHVDIADRLVEAGDHVHRFLDGARTAVVWGRLPMVLPQIAQLTSPDEPLGAVVALGQRLATPPVRNVSVFGGFSLADVAECGVSVCVTVDAGHEAHGAEVVRSLGAALWEQRPRYRLHAVPLADAVAEAGRAARGERAPALLADVADNPGGGAPATSTFVLSALAAAQVGHVVLGLQCDRAVVDAAWTAGVGGRLAVGLNAGSERPLARPFAGDAEVLALTDAPLVPTRGVYAGATRHVGRCCALRFRTAGGAIDVGISSHPVQCADDDTLRHAGLDVDAARVVVVKSRGHFRAGFDHLFAPEQIIEVGAPGVATPALHTVEWQHLPRPVFPLDDVAVGDVEPVLARRGQP
jgi:microcystin degradation protein MlrC